MEFTDFTAKDFAEYQAWFQDEVLNSQLGPAPDEEWLEYVLSDALGKQFCVFDQGEIVAVVGVVLPTLEHRYCVVSDIAVKPELRGKGIGKLVLAELVRQVSLQAGEYWKAFVEETNLNAIAFFHAAKWKLQPESSDDSMCEFVFSS